MNKTTTKKNAPKARRETETVVCPHCDTECLVSENGRYECPNCTGQFDVDWFDTPHVHQPDLQTCGWATTKWLLSAFGCEMPSNKQLERELHVRKGRDGLSGALLKAYNYFIEAFGKKWNWQKIDSQDISGTLPTDLVATLNRHGLKPVFPGIRELLRYSDYKNYMKEVFAQQGRFALFYVNTTRDGSYAHWIGIEKFKNRVRVMDPMDYDYSPFSKHEAIRSKRIRACCMIGFVRA